MHKNQLIFKIKIIAVLFPALFVFALPVFSQTYFERALESIKQGDTSAIEQAENKLGLPKRADIRYTASNLKDPFYPDGFISEKTELAQKEAMEPITTRAIQPPPLSIQGIIWSKDNPLVIINNQVLRQKDTIKLPESMGEVTIINIDKNAVTMLYSGQTIKLPAPAKQLQDIIKGGRR